MGFTACADKIVCHKSGSNSNNSEDIAASSISNNHTQLLTILFLPDHPDSHTHHISIRSLDSAYIPVPSGPSIPHRDLEQTMHRHAHLMLLFFKPWRSITDLKRAEEKLDL
ncbi:hypothetical protein BDQ17DRAFT_1259406 [Cyathus striatus]|nr:hypothetical protein BDQ17DRAFT_1259406 [Cyathus striatus]